MLKTLIMKAALVAFLGSISFAAFAIADTQRFEVPAGDLAAALESLAKQANVDLVYQDAQVRGLRTAGVSGNLSPRDAVVKLLEGTPLEIRTDEDSGAILITTPTPSGGPSPQASEAIDNPSPGTGEGRGEGKMRWWQRLAQATPAAGTEEGQGDGNSSPGTGEEGARDRGKVREGQEGQELPAPEETGRAIPEILVHGTRVLNTDIRRSRDDVQPYVVFEREAIENSSATNLEDFLKTRLTMNTQGSLSSQGPSTIGSVGEVNLRGLGSGQTLILIDGRRTTGIMATVPSPLQSDLNGIPLAAIERVEVLPTTASGIYGGAATGGVINIVLRRDYSGVELKTTYQNTFSSDAAMLQADLGAGFSLGPNTNVLFAASWSDRNPLSVQDRDLFSDGRARIRANNPAFYANAFSPPLGRTTNIRSANGSPLFGPGTPNNTFVPEGYGGGGGLAPLQANAGQYNFDLAQTGQPGGGGTRSLLNQPRVTSAIASVRQQFSPRLQAFLELAAAENTGRFELSEMSGSYSIAADAPNNPFGQAIRVTAPISQADGRYLVQNDSRRLVAGLIAGLSDRWQGALDYSRQETAFQFDAPPFFLGTEVTPISTGSIDLLRDLSRFPADFSAHLVPLYWTRRTSTADIGALRISGPVSLLPGKVAFLSGLIEYRRENFGDANQVFSTFVTYFPSRQQTVKSAYLETRLPLVSAGQGLPLLQELEVQLAARFDDYEVDGATTSVNPGSPVVRRTNRTDSLNPTIGLRLKPFDALLLRASYGTGFLAPSVGQLASDTPVNTMSSIGDPRRGNLPIGAYRLTSGGNADLKPEESESWSAGLVFTPRFLPELRASLDWTRIKKTDNITSPSIQLLLDNEDILPGRVTRGPASEDPFGVGAITALDATSINLSAATIEAWDAALDYTLTTSSAGNFSAFVGATRQTHLITQVAPSTRAVENVGITSSNPLKFKANAGLTWKYGNWTAGWTVVRFDSYQVAFNPTTNGATTVANQGSLRVPAQTYHDVFATYRWEARQAAGLQGILSDTEVRLAARNVFNAEPPFDAASSTLYSRFGDPRLSVYEISLRKSF